MFGRKKEDSGSLPDLPPARYPTNTPRVQSPASQSRSRLLEESNDEEEDSETNLLPSFPDSPLHNRISEAAIKDAVNDDEEEKSSTEDLDEETESEEPEEKSSTEDLDEEETPRKKIKVVEMDEWAPTNEKDFESPFKPQMKSAMKPMQEKFPLPPKEIDEPIRKIRSEPKMVSTRSRAAVPDIFVKIDKFHAAKRALEDIKLKLDEVEGLLEKIREVKMREEQELGVWERDLSQIKSRVQDVVNNVFEKVD